MEESVYQEKAIPLITVDDKTGKYVLTNEGHNFLRSIPGPIGVVSVAGMYRTGKSYLLNRMLLNRSSGFGVGNTVNACTKGLWCWGTPIKGTSIEGDTVNIIVIDTEGIGALDEDQTHDTRIFTLAILASSCFIYNSTGSIDETALQNLSLVVNLTKHIQIKSGNGENEQFDPDDFAHYFPMFYWVVRDFSLQLQTPEGDPITPKEYLERALSPKNGFSEDTQQKNRIRRLLSSFFKQRDCFTLIRPLVNETQLQSLDQMELDKLRPQFVNEVIKFRKRVINRIKVKTINDKKLNGQMYSSMLSSYVMAINDGAVPNIENAWNYMCREQSTRLLQQSYDFFDAKLKEIRIPVNEDVFNRESEKAVEQALEMYREKLVGDDIPEIWRELNQKIKERVNSRRRQNDAQGKAKVNEYIKTHTQAYIQEKAHKVMKSGGTWDDIAADIETAFQQFTKNGPDVTNKKTHYLQTTRKMISQVAGGFIKKEKNKIKQLETLRADDKKLHQEQIQRISDQLQQTQNRAQQTIKQLDREKVQMKISLESMEKMLENLKSEKKHEEETLGKNLEGKKKELQNTKKLLEQKLEEATANYNQASKTLLTQEKEWEKDRAVYELKIQQFEKRLQDYEKKEITFNTDLNEEKKELLQKLRQNTLKYEEEITTLRTKYTKLNDEHTASEEAWGTEKERLEERLETLQTKERKFKQDLSEKTKELDSLKRQYEIQKMKIENKYSADREDIDRDYETMKDNLKKSDQTIKNLKQTIDSQKVTFENEKAQMQQQIQFCNQKINDLKQSLSEATRTYQSTIETLESARGEANEQLENQRLQDVKNCHAQELHNLQAEHESVKQSLQFNIDNLTKKRDELTLQLKLAQTSRQAEKQESDATIDSLKQTVQRLTQKNKSLEREMTTKLMEKDAEAERKIRSLEEEMENFKERESMESNERHRESESSLTQLKNHFEMEKERLEARMMNEKAKYEKKIRELTEEHENELRTAVEQLEEERDSLLEDKAINDDQYNSNMKSMQDQLDNAKRESESFQKAYRELKQSSTKKEQDLEEKLSNLTTISRNQRNAHFEKIEAINCELNKKEKENTNLIHINTSLSNNLKKKETDCEQLISEINNLKESTSKTIEELRAANKTLGDEFVENKLNYEKELALTKHSEEHSKRQIEKLQARLKQMTDDSEDKLRRIKEETSNELRVNENKILREKALIEEKYEKLKKISRENQNNFKREISELTREKAVDRERITNLEERIKELESKGMTDVRALQAEIEKLRETTAADKKTLTEELYETKQSLQTVSKEKKDVEAVYEREKGLWEQKLAFIERSKQEQRQESQQKITQLTKTMESLQRDKLNQKSTSQTTYNDRITQLERTHRLELQKTSESHRREIQELTSNYQQCEMQLKLLTEKSAVEIQSKTNILQTQQRKIQQFTERIDRLENEISVLKADRDRAILQKERQSESERDHYKAKLSKVQQSLKKKENQMNVLFFDYEKSKVKIETEKENLLQQMIDLKERLEKREKELSKLKGDNEKLKAEKKTAKAHSFITNNNNNKWNTTFIEQKKYTSPSSKAEEDNKENQMNHFE